MSCVANGMTVHEAVAKRVEETLFDPDQDD
jgi:hypothetical protein